MFTFNVLFILIAEEDRSLEHVKVPILKDMSMWSNSINHRILSLGLGTDGYEDSAFKKASFADHVKVVIDFLTWL